MRYTRPALVIATAFLALSSLGAAHADDNDESAKHHNGDVCFIRVEGNHNHNACGDIKYGDNATTGQGQSVLGLGSIRQSGCETVSLTWYNHTAPGVTIQGDASTQSPYGFDGNFSAPSTSLVPGITPATWCTSDDSDDGDANIMFRFSAFGSGVTGSVNLIGPQTITFTSDDGTYGLSVLDGTRDRIVVAVCTLGQQIPGDPPCQEGS
ncbi:hypothetical protein [Streptomyces sp. NPDC086023]|uniref:hypothetical protein n=1 Tax=Streptomyces sp. NPDC086023 TaxID=3365746 RepID=UPI0037CF8E1C